MGELKDLIELGKCKIYSVMEGAENKCLTVENNAVGQADIILKTEDEKEEQLFSLRISDNQDLVFATNEENSLVMDVCGGRNKEGSHIIQYRYHGGDNQLFQLEDKGSGQYVIKSKLGNAVGVEGKKVADDTPIILWSNNEGDNQRFVVKLVEISDYFKKLISYIEVNQIMGDLGQNIENIF
jgi:ribosomal protein S6E (S10)